LINACSQTLSFDQDWYSSISSHSRGAMVCQALLLWPIILKHANYIKISYPGNKNYVLIYSFFPWGLLHLWKEMLPKNRNMVGNAPQDLSAIFLPKS
jgi:hypothetical protein